MLLAFMLEMPVWTLRWWGYHPRSLVTRTAIRSRSLIPIRSFFVRVDVEEIVISSGMLWLLQTTAMTVHP